MAASPDPFETAAYQWKEGERRMRDAPSDQRRILDRIVTRIVAELRRRLGGRFRAQELVDLYDRGTTWCMDIAATAAPDDPWAWDPRVVVDAAFARYLREAEDYAGGRRTLED
jgi:hypothetical protein